MKKKQIKNLALSKTVIAKIHLSAQQQLKGGTDPISPPEEYPRTQDPGAVGYCVMAQ